VLLGCHRHVTTQKDLRVPHPSRFVRRVGPYVLTPQLLFLLLL